MYVTVTPAATAMEVHDGSAVMVVGQVAVLLEELLELGRELTLALLAVDEELIAGALELDRELTLALLAVDEELIAGALELGRELTLALLDEELEKVPRGIVETLLLVMLEVADVVEAMGLELVTVFELAFDVLLRDTWGVEMLDIVIGVVMETVTKAYK